MNKVIALLAAIAGGFVLSIVTAILTARFWGWFEERTGIESLGHSGPADWIYLFLWVLYTIVLFCFFCRRGTQKTG
jgi:hypothetical protein